MSCSSEEVLIETEEDLRALYERVYRYVKKEFKEKRGDGFHVLFSSAICVENETRVTVMTSVGAAIFPSFPFTTSDETIYLLYKKKYKSA